MFSCEYSKSFTDNFFYRTTLVAAFDFSFNIQKKIKEKKVSAEIAFALISLFHVQIQKPAHRSTTLRAFISLAKFAEFYYHKNLKQEVHDDLRVCVDERSPCGLTTIGDIKIYQCHMIKT